MGHSKIETTKNTYGHLFAQDRALILDAMNPAVSRLYVYENGNQERARGMMQLPDAPIEVGSPTGCRAGDLLFLGLNGSDLGGGTRT